MTDIVALYNDRVAQGILRDDPVQRAVLPEFERIRQAVEIPVKRGLFRKAPPPPKGLYLWGGVGRGKSMVMDLFVDSLTVPVRRVHFHEFMQEIQNALHEARQLEIADALAPVAQSVIDQVRVLAFDEMQVKDIADAMIVGRLFEKLFQAGVVIVTTSNRIPQDLYKDGLNRQLFLPFIDLICEKLVVHEMRSDTDYRQDRLSGEDRYFMPLNGDTRQKMNEIWQDLSGGQAREFRLVHKGRDLIFPQFHNGVARLSFFDLCGKMLGPGDYLAIAQTVRVIMIDDIPQMGRTNFNELKRFVTLIDALYEAKTKVICSAAARPEMLYLEGEGVFEFERTASRLREMQAVDWGN